MGQSGIETSTYVDKHGLREIVRISSKWHEKKSGFQPETTDEELVCILNGEYWLVHFHRHQTFGPGGAPPDDRLTPVKKVERAEYERLKAEFGILDTPQYFEQRRTDVARKQFLQAELDRLTPKCPKCRKKMTLRRSDYGRFWGCREFPNCHGKRDADPVVLLQRDKLLTESISLPE